MNIWEWLTGRLSNRGKALSLYRRGMERAKRQDHVGAFDDYSAIISMPGVPPDVQAMALFNRALVLAADGDSLLAIDDLNAVLALAATPKKVKLEAHRKLVRMKRQSGNTDGEAYPTASRASGMQ